MSNTESTLDKIQREIRETLKREEELKNGYSKHQNGYIENGSDSGETEETEKSRTNGIHEPVNGILEKSDKTTTQLPKTNGFIRRFTPNTATKGVMQKFFKSRGKVNNTSMLKTEKNGYQNGWSSDISFEPPKLSSIEKGKPIRNGFVPAKEKIVKELSDFQQREAELRKIRRESQPDLMAALQLEDNLVSSEWESSVKEENTIKHAKSIANLYQPEDEEIIHNNSAPSSLKPAYSLAALCDLSDDELEMPGKKIQLLLLC